MDIKVISTSTWKDFVALLSPCVQCNDCWCLNHRMHPNKLLHGESAKNRMEQLVAQNEVGGLLGYLNSECVGWISIDPLASQIGHDYILEGHEASKNSWTIHCLYIAPKHRGKGLSKGLIKAAIEHAKENDAEKILAFPIPEISQGSQVLEDDEFSGRYSTYKELGFVNEFQMNDFYQVMALEI